MRHPNSSHRLKGVPPAWDRSIWRSSTMHSGFPPATAPFLLSLRSTLNEQIGTYVKKICQFLSLRFAYRSLAVKHLGGNSFRAEYFPQVFLRQATGLHQMLEGPLRTCFPNWIATFLILVNEHGQQFSKFLLFRRRALTFVETQQLAREPFAFCIRADHMGERAPQELPVRFLVEIYRCRAHCFQAPL